MRKTLGVLVFVVGVAGLGYWGAKTQAVSIQGKVTEAAEAAIAGALHPVEVTVSGRDITLTGTADTQAELDMLVAALDSVRGRRVISASGVDVLPDVTPYETALAKGADGTLAMTGYVPSNVARGALAEAGLPVSDLPLAHGAPTGWAEAMAAGAAALAPLKEGSFALTGTTATLTGVAAGRAEDDAARDALAAVGAGFDQVAALQVEDPGLVEMSLDYDADSGFSLRGVAPSNMGVRAISSALGGVTIDGSAASTMATAPGLARKLAALKTVLPDLESFALDANNDGTTVYVEVLPGIDPDTVRAAIEAALGGTDAALMVEVAAASEDGSERINPVTGLTQRAFGGFWFTVPAFEASKATCTQAAMELVEATPIRFVTGSADLDPASIRVVNDLAGVISHCTQGVGMRVDIGGHTDAQGDDLANYSLSVARARAVRDALAARGVAAGRMSPVGHGETEPIADNDTAEGRALNRRTTFSWPD